MGGWVNVWEDVLFEFEVADRIVGQAGDEFFQPLWGGGVRGAEEAADEGGVPDPIGKGILVQNRAIPQLYGVSG